MKPRTLFCLLALLASKVLFAQGTINFANLVIVDSLRVVDAPVRDLAGQLLSGNSFAAQLYVFGGGPVGPPATFLTGAQAGYFSGGTRTIDFLQPGQHGARLDSTNMMGP